MSHWVALLKIQAPTERVSARAARQAAPGIAPRRRRPPRQGWRVAQPAPESQGAERADHVGAIGQAEPRPGGGPREAVSAIAPQEHEGGGRPGGR